MWLRVKVFIGYVSLIFLLIITVGLFRKEQVNRDRLRQEEQKLHLVRGLVEQSYAGLAGGICGRIVWHCFSWTLPQSGR